jgi:transposase InsO family protein
MSAAISIATGRPYGVKRVCATWGVARSTFYAAPPEAEPARRGPAPVVCDEELYALIDDDLECSPFTGEGHRPVWARLRVSGIRVSRRRVLRLMREHGLLSPRRVRQGADIAHDGTITTDAPDLMWGTDGTRVLTADEGMCWIFTSVDHFNCEVVGHHVCKRGDRFAALQPVSQGLLKHFGDVGADVGRGLSLRMDHGTQYVSDHFRNQVRFWGVEASYAFIEQPQGNGVAERFFRTLKEQVVYGRVYRTVAELREAVDGFIALYNDQWRPEKNGFRSPSETREAWYARQGQEAAA